MTIKKLITLYSNAITILSSEQLLQLAIKLQNRLRKHFLIKVCNYNVQKLFGI